jgi:hypothetical protein
MINEFGACNYSVEIVMSKIPHSLTFLIVIGSPLLSIL